MLLKFFRDGCSKLVRSTLFQQTFCQSFLNLLHAICIFWMALAGTGAYIMCAWIWVFKWQFYIWNAVKLFVNYQMHHLIEPVMYSKDCYNSRYCGREVFWDCLAWRGPLMTPLPGNYLICAHQWPPPNPIKHKNRPLVLTEFFNILELFGRWNKTTWNFVTYA